MAYEKTTWQNGKTAINASNMNHIEEGIFKNSTDVENLKKNLGTTVSKTDISSLINSSYFDTSKSSMFYEKKNGFVTLSGALFVNASMATSKVFLVGVLPDACFPTMGIHNVCFVTNLSTSFIAFANIKAKGSKDTNGNDTSGHFFIGYPENETPKDYRIYFTIVYST